MKKEIEKTPMLFECRECGCEVFALPAPEVEVDLDAHPMKAHVGCDGLPCVTWEDPFAFLQAAYGHYTAMIPVVCKRCGAAGEVCRDRLLGEE